VVAGKYRQVPSSRWPGGSLDENVEIDDQELWEEETDAGGTLMLALPEGTDAGVRIHRRAD
jgi:hypothetical protein